MRKVISVLSLCLVLSAFAGLQAQNIQLHYDFGRSLYNADLNSRSILTTTVEKFQPDAWGSTFFFVDMDYTSKGVASAYWEIARELKFWKGPFSARIEYNGGLTNAFSFNNAYLGGATYTWNDASFGKGFTLTAMYKHIQKHDEPHNFQLTGTWYMNFCDRLLTFCGFADYWREKYADRTMIFLSEPQFWVNLNRLKGVNKNFNLSVGTEVEISNNFVRKGFYAIPTLAVKWTLN